VVRDTRHLYKSKEIVFTLIGRVNAIIKAHRTDSQSFRMVLPLMKILDGPIKASSRGGYLYKDIETYGIVKITDKGLSYQ
jgi:ATP-dependent DNA helicase RecQ